MILEFMGMAILLFIGAIFSAVGNGFLFSDRFFKKNGRKTNGTVKAIEKYKGTTSSSHGHRQTQIYYRPIVEYIYHNQTRIVKGAGCGEVRYKLKQTVPILILDDPESDQIKARIANDNANLIIGFAFILAGLGALCVYVSQGGLWLLALAAFIISAFVGRAFSSLACNFKVDVSSSEDDQFVSPDSVLIETKAGYIAEIAAHNFWGKLIAYALMFASFGIMYAGYNMLPDKASELFLVNFGEFLSTVTSGDMPRSWEKALIVFGIGAFFFLASLRSVYYVSTKYGGARRI